MVVSWLKLDSTAKKTYPRATTDKQKENENCGNYYTHKIVPKTLHFEQKQLGLNTFSSRISDISFDSKGCLKFRLKDFP